jgi:hypothetical protein
MTGESIRERVAAAADRDEAAEHALALLRAARDALASAEQIIDLLLTEPAPPPEEAPPAPAAMGQE